MKPMLLFFLTLAANPLLASDWKFDIGLLGYAGNNPWNEDTRVLPLPYLGISWGDRLSFSVDNGLALHAGSEDSGSLSISLHFDQGREGKELSLQWQALGDIKPTPTLTISGGYLILGFLKFDGSVTHLVDYDGSAKGQTVRLSMASGLPITDQWILFTQGGASLASHDYLQSYYGISKRQANQHDLTPFEPKSGIYQYDYLVGVMFEPGDRWSAMIGVGNSWLVGDARKSPLVERKHTLSAFAGVTYSF